MATGGYRRVDRWNFDTYTCEHCSAEFKAYPDAQAAATGYCSPACQNAIA